jgi:hypothetical protein
MASEIVLPDGFKIAQLMEIRSKMEKVYDDWIENFKEKNLEKAKDFTVYFGRDISMNFITTKFRLSAPKQTAGSEEEKSLTFMEVRRILNWMLHGNDPFKKWAAVKDTDLKESLMDSILKKAKTMLIENGYPETTVATFAVENSEEKGNYTVRIYKPKAPNAGAGGDNEFKEVKPKKTFKSENKVSKTYKDVSKGTKAVKADKTINATQKVVKVKTEVPSEIFDEIVKTIEAYANFKNVNIASQGQKANLAMKLCGMMGALFETL